MTVGKRLKLHQKEGVLLHWCPNIQLNPDIFSICATFLSSESGFSSLHRGAVHFKKLFLKIRLRQKRVGCHIKKSTFPVTWAVKSNSIAQFLWILWNFNHPNADFYHSSLELAFQFLKLFGVDLEEYFCLHRCPKIRLNRDIFSDFAWKSWNFAKF